MKKGSERFVTAPTFASGVEILDTHATHARDRLWAVALDKNRAEAIANALNVAISALARKPAKRDTRRAQSGRLQKG